MNKQNFSRTYSFSFALVFFLILLIPVYKLDTSPADINGNFHGKERLISMVANSRVWLGDRVYNRVVVGKDDWLVYTGELSTDDYQNTISFSDKELQSLQVNIDALYEDYASRGIKLLVVIPPNKNTIYPEFIPQEISVLGTESRLDQIVNYMDTHGKVEIIDLRSVMLEGKKNEQVYYASDSHWNQYGAFLAYREIISQVAFFYPQIDPLSMADSSEVATEETDLPKIIGTTLFTEKKIENTPIQLAQASFRNIPLSGVPRSLSISYVPDEKLPSAVVYHDSFFTALKPYISEHFRQVIYIPHYAGITDFEWVNEFEPDIVIIEFTERYVHSLVGMLQNIK